VVIEDLGSVSDSLRLAMSSIEEQSNNIAQVSERTTGLVTTCPPSEKSWGPDISFQISESETPGTLRQSLSGFAK